MAVGARAAVAVVVIAGEVASFRLTVERFSAIDCFGVKIAFAFDLLRDFASFAVELDSAELDFAVDAKGCRFDYVLEMKVDSNAADLLEAEIVSKMIKKFN